jgi:hypothetical protein
VQQHTILFSRGVIDIGVDWRAPIPSTPPRPVVHLLKDPQDEETACGHTVRPGDTIEALYFDGQAIECAGCKNAVNGT